MARKTIVIEQEQIDLLAKLAGVGMNYDQMADFLEISPATFDKILERQPEVKQAILKGRSNGAGKVMQSLYQMATTGKNVTAMIFYLKTRCRWKDTPDIDVSNAQPILLAYPRKNEKAKADDDTEE